MTANIISIVVVMVFLYILAKKTLLPRLALKRAAKAGQEVDTAKVPALSAADFMQAGRFPRQGAHAPLPVACFDMRLIKLYEFDDNENEEDYLERRIKYEANEMLLGLCSRGIAPSLKVLMLSSGCMMLYVTYTAP